MVQNSDSPSPPRPFPAGDELKSAPTVKMTPEGRVIEAAGPSGPSGDAFPAVPQGFLGDYEILGEIGSGSMGVVYKARQKKLDRLVALKMLLASSWASADQVRRFELEARAMAKLLHPNLVKIFDAGEVHGIHYFVMEYIAGKSLQDRLREGPPSFDEGSRLLSLVARAVDHLHANGIVHRDLKPANILLDGEGQPFVTDFGIAKVAGGEDVTQTGFILGTLCYMPPEQAAGKIDAVDRRSDIYSLGAILYELLTGRSPVISESPLEALVQVLEREPPRPRSLRPDIPAELEQICLRCMEKSPADRYPTAAHLADDLERFLRQEPVEARPTSVPLRTLRWARRNPTLASRLGAMALFYAAQLVNFHFFHTIDLPLHLQLTGVLLAWAATTIGFQRLSQNARWALPGVFAWGALDVVFVTAILLFLNSVVSPLIVVLPLLIVASGLWSHARCVWFMTAATIASYIVLAMDFHRWRPERYSSKFEVSGDRHVLFIVMLIVTGGIVAYQVRRAQALSRYFQSRFR